LGRPFGNLELSRRLEELEQELQNYFGAIAEVRANVRTTVPDKPEALLLTEQCQELGLPLVQGGVEDQPYIWIREYRLCVQTKALFDAINKAQENKENG